MGVLQICCHSFCNFTFTFTICHIVYTDTIIFCYLGGLTANELGSLTTTQVAAIQPSSIAEIPAAAFVVSCFQRFNELLSRLYYDFGFYLIF